MLLSGYVRNLAATEADIDGRGGGVGLGVDEWMASYPRMLGQLTDPRRFPRSPRSSRPGCSKPPTTRTTSSSSA
jgi:hypothetical protein